MVLLLCSMILPATVLLSQQKNTTYFRIYLGYDAGYAGGELGSNTVAQPDSYKSETITGSIGGGFNFSVTGGYYVEKNLSLELGYLFKLSPRILFEHIDEPDRLSQSDAKLMSHFIGVGPGLYVPMKNMDLTLYGRFGILLPVGRQFTIESTSSVNFEQYDYSQATWQTEKYAFHFSPGFYASLAAAWPLGKKVYVFGEIATQLVSVTYKSSEIIRYKSITTDLMTEHTYGLYNLTTAERYSNYLNEITGDDNIPLSPDFDENQPTDKLTRRLSASSFGFSVGILYTVRWKDLIHKKR